MKKQIHYLLFISFLNIGSLIGQNNLDEKLYYDFQIDYLPTFENAHLEISKLGLNFNNSTNLEEVFQVYFSTLLGKSFKLKKKSGLTTFSSAIPSNYFETTKFIIEFGTTGYVNKIDFSGKKLFDEPEKIKIQQTLQKSKFLPALKNGKPVSVILYYVISLDTSE